MSVSVRAHATLCTRLGPSTRESAYNTTYPPASNLPNHPREEPTRVLRTPSSVNILGENGIVAHTSSYHFRFKPPHPQQIPSSLISRGARTQRTATWSPIRSQAARRLE